VVIDYHTHFVPPDCQDFEAVAGGTVYGSRTDTVTGEMWVDGRLRRLGAAGDQPWGVAADNPLWSVARRIEDMDRTGVDMQALSVPPYMCLYEAPADVAWKLSRRANAGMAAAIGGERRFVGFATVPLQDPPVAARELEYAVGSLGLGGVQILTRIGKRGLDDPRLAVFWKAVTELDIPVFLHPANTLDPLQRRYYLSNLIGNPTETAVATAHLIFGGVIDRFPSLRFVLAHAGGTVPALLGRWVHGSEVIPELEILQRPVRDYLPSFWFDTVAHDPAFIELMLRPLGLQMVVGTDYPFDMGDLDPLRTLDAVPGLTPERRAEITGANLFPSAIEPAAAPS
jgi:aminocarboxymuconate-semialdehyde decarboxylase